MLDGRQWPVLQIYACRNSVWSTLTSLLFFWPVRPRTWLHDKAVGAPNLRRNVGRSRGEHDDWPLFASRDQQIEFIELHENEEKAARIRTCRLQPGFPADKDLRTQYEWSKKWMKKRARESAPEDDNPQEQNSQGAGFHDNDILPEGCGKGAGEDNAGAVAVAVRRTPPTTKKVPVDSEAAEPRRRRRLRRATKIDNILTSVRAGSPAIQLIRPDGESGDLDMDVEDLIDVCIKHPHVRSVELQVRDIA